MAPSQHHHDREFAKRRLVAVCVTQGDTSWQRRDIDAVCSGKRHLQQAQLRRRRKSVSPSSGQQYIRIGERRGRLCRFIVIKDFGTDVGSDEFNDWRSLRGSERTQEQHFHCRLILWRRQIRIVSSNTRRNLPLTGLALQESKRQLGFRVV